MKSLKGAVLETFGAGNAPNDIVEVLKEATAPDNPNRVLIVNVTQCLKGTVESIYATGNVCLIIDCAKNPSYTFEYSTGMYIVLVTTTNIPHDTNKYIVPNSSCVYLTTCM